ncbi:hypothetical protein MLD38_022401 [Melastoma candidum]|uniref:Uncharacterized protein n=1 Tax=Melastoma candidum TaxID=119954 RepID=A0ACB9QS93_9MYRT|nr:hypothetical protein MLD38_022401 [Melastoma candidum]
MACVYSMHVPPELRFSNKLGRGFPYADVLCKDRMHLSRRTSLSAHSQLARGLHLLSRGRGPVRPISSRHNAFFCHCYLLPGMGNGMPALKDVALVLRRSCDAFSASPLVYKLVSAVGVISFATWCLVPLVRFTRVIFLHKSDNSWKKSTSHHILTSYIQPLMIWTGVTLICRALDPVVLPTEASQAVKLRLLNFVRSLSTVLAFSYCLSGIIQQAQKFSTEANDSGDARNMGFDFAGKAIYTAVWVAAVSLFMELLGFSTQKWLTAGGLGTVLLTLAGREIFTNFLSSIMIHATRPFVVNEWIQTKIQGYEVSGTVEHVGWWSPTIIRGDDREAVHIPNHKFTVSVVRNLSQKSHWRIKTYIAISHLDVHKINNIVADMRKVLAKNPQVEQQRLHRRVFMENIDPENQALMVLISCFVKTSHFEEYLCVKEAILLDLLRVVSHHRARLATPIRTVQKIYAEADMENVPFADTIFNQTGAAANRPLLLIEPSSYKVNNNEDNKSKGSPKSTRTTSEEKDTNPASDLDRDDKVNADALALTKEKMVASQKDASKEGNPTEVSEVNMVVSSESLGKGDNSQANPQIKPERERPLVPKSTDRSPLEENIVLGVALDGSKRTLPIEEQMGVPNIPTEPKELAARTNGKEKKDGQVSSAS